MNKKDLIGRVTDFMRDNNIRKPISSAKHVFHISDDEGNCKDFVIKKTNRSVIYTKEDVAAVLDSCMDVIGEALKQGEPVSVHGFGTLGLKYREPRKTKRPGTDEWVDVTGRYIPKFSFGNDLRMCAKIYELSINDRRLEEPCPVYENDVEQDGD